MKEQENLEKASVKGSQNEPLVMQISNELENFKGDLTDTAIIYKDKSSHILLNELNEIIGLHKQQLLKITTPIDDEKSKLQHLKHELRKAETRVREANIFIKWIAEMLGMETDGIGFDEIKCGIDDFQEALKIYVDKAKSA